jgi:hypothetical protein
MQTVLMTFLPTSEDQFQRQRPLMLTDQDSRLAPQE